MQAAFKRQIESSENGEKMVEEITKKLKAVSSPFRTAEQFGIEEIIDPRDTRSLICRWLKMIENRPPNTPKTVFSP